MPSGYLWIAVLSPIHISKTLASMKFNLVALATLAFMTGVASCALDVSRAQVTQHSPHLSRLNVEEASAVTNEGVADNRVLPRALGSDGDTQLAEAGHGNTPHDHGDAMPSETDGHDMPHGSDMHDGHGHDSMSGDPLFHHGSIEVSSSDPIPAVTVVVHSDERRGWNVEIQTENFAFAPEQVNQANQPNQGHGHIYVDGEKITRLYSNWYYIERLEPGMREITVSLHANGHEVLVHEGEAIAHTATVEVPEPVSEVSEPASVE